MTLFLTFHSHGEDVGGDAVAVGRLALVLAVVGQLDAAEAEAMFVHGHIGAGLLQSAVLLLPLHRRSRPADRETPAGFMGIRGRRQGRWLTMRHLTLWQDCSDAPLVAMETELTGEEE